MSPEAMQCPNAAPAAAVRPAQDADAVACRTILPEAFPPAGSAPELFVAVAPDGEIRGALAMAWVPRGFPVLARVADRWRRRGIGSALLRAAIAAAGGETAALRSWGQLEDTSDGTSFLLKNGFHVIHRLLTFETDAVRFGDAMTGLLARITAAGKVPDNTKLMTLAEAPAAEVIRLVAPQFATLPHDVAWRIAPGTANGYDPALSLVLLHGVAVAGAMLCRRSGDLVEVDVNVVAPGLRRGWANLLLLEGMARRCRAAGVTRFRFSCEEHVRDTLNLARRCGAQHLPPQVVLALPLPCHR